MADLVTRLLLNSTQFDNNILASANKIRSFQSTGKSVGTQLNSSFSSVVGVLGKMGLGFGAVASAGAVFKGVMDQSQWATDGLGIKIEQTKSQIDSLFHSIASGDLESFVRNFSAVSRSAEEFAAAVDNAGTSTVLITPEIELHKARYQELLATAQNVGLSESERKTALAGATSELNKQVNLMRTLEKIKEYKNFSGLESAVTNKHGKPITRKSMNYMLSVDSSTGEANYQKILNEGKKLEEREKELAKKQDIDGLASIYLSKQYKNLQIAKAIDSVEATEEGQKLIQDYKMGIVTAQAMESMIAQEKKNLAKTEKRIISQNGEGKGAKTTKEDVIPSGSIAEVEDELQSLQKNFQQATTDTARAALQAKINELKEIIRLMNFKATNPTAPNVGNGSTSLKQTANPAKGLTVKGFGTVYTQKDVKTTNDYADSLNAVAQIMGNIQSSTDGAASSWLGFAGNLMTSVAGMITAIEALNAANKAEQASASGAAVAEGVKSAAQTPVVGWLLAGAAAVSVIAALASMPKYAEGGIFKGGSSIGDMNIARVNSGEMILNGTQQGRLFSMINDGGTTQQSGKVEFKVRGQELVGVLNNYNSKMGKLR